MMLAKSYAVKRVVTCFILSTTTTTTTTNTIPPKFRIPTTISSSQQQQQQQQQQQTSSSSSSPSQQNVEIMTRENIRVAVFQRKSTMPTFPSHWAGISGSIENGETPQETAQRELQEETNLVPVLSETAATTTANTTTTTTTNNNVYGEFYPMGGLYLDVPFQVDKKIRVYPFVVHLLGSRNTTNKDNKDNNSNNDDDNNNTIENLLQLKGTEHDRFQFISIPELEALQPTVPGLADAFHRATHGQYMAQSVLPESIWEWSCDRVNGAAALTKQIMTQIIMISIVQEDELLLCQQQQQQQQQSSTIFETIAALRPTMVPIVNVMRTFEELKNKQQESKDSRSGGGGGGDSNEQQQRLLLQDAGRNILNSLDVELERCLQLGADTLAKLYQEAITKATTNSNPAPICFTIATFSRSSTIWKIIQRFLEQNSLERQKHPVTINILCAKSTPGDEGKFMAEDLSAVAKNYKDWVTVTCIGDEILHQSIHQGTVQVVLVGSDCVMEQQVINKVGTKALAETCRRGANVSMISCADRWKLWDDIFPPPLEDIFECVPRNLMDYVLVPEPLERTTQQCSK